MVMSSANDTTRWSLSGFWPKDRVTASPSVRPAGASPDQPSGDIAGQVSEHLRRHLRGKAESLACGAPADSLSSGQASSILSGDPSGLASLPPFWPPGTDNTLSDEEQRAIEMLYEQKLGPSPSGTPFLTFKLHDFFWGVSVHYLREALPSVPTITPLPFSPLWLYGLINLRGEPIGLVNLGELLLDPLTAASHRAAIGAPVIVAESEGASLALLVEELGQVVFIEEHLFEKLPGAKIRALPPFAVSHLQAAWTPSQDAEPILLLDLPALITSLLQQLTSDEASDD
jgi:chemotaxis signal transduction protein